jgi:hypothetical protein
MPIHTSQLPDFVENWSEESNDFATLEARSLYTPWTLHYDTVVDETLDPFSDAYFECQIALYNEVSGRHLDQSSGELHPLNVQTLLAGLNRAGFAGGCLA